MGDPQKKLLRICRTCCNKIVRDRHYVTPKHSTEYLEEIKSLFGYNLSNDKVNVHPPDLSNSCLRKLARVRYFKGNVEYVHMVIFYAHTDDMWKICSKVSLLLLSTQNFSTLFYLWNLCQSYWKSDKLNQDPVDFYT